MAPQNATLLAPAREEIERLRALAYKSEERRAHEKQLSLLLAFGSLVAIAIASALSPSASFVPLAAAAAFVAVAFAAIRLMIIRSELHDLKRLDHLVWESKKYISEISNADEFFFRNMIDDIVQGRDLEMDRYNLLAQSAIMIIIPLGVIAVRLLTNV